MRPGHKISGISKLQKRAEILALTETDRTNNALDLKTYFSQAIVFFWWIIVLVIMGVMIAGAVGPSPILMWPITLTILILPVRAFVAWPDRELKKRQDLQATAELTAAGVLPRLQTALTTLARNNSYHEPIKIIIGSATDKMNAAGSWRRHYLFIGHEVAQRLDSDLQAPERRTVAEAALLHEIAHFLHRDVQRVGYIRELLYGSFVVILWWMVFLLGWLGFIGLMGPAVLNFDLSQLSSMDPITLERLELIASRLSDRQAEIAKQAESVSIGLVLNYITNAFMPIIWMGFFLWLFFWRRMLRLQEHYADYFVNSILQQPSVLRAAWLDYEPQSLIIIAAQQKLSVRLREAWRTLLFRVTELLPFVTSFWYWRLTDQFYQIKAWFNYHPTFDQRMTLLLNPRGIYESWQSVAFTTLALVLALEVLLVTPLIGYHVGSTYVIHFATLAIFILLATWALPLLVQQQAVTSPLKKSLVLIYGLRWVWILLNFFAIIFLAVVAPDYAWEILNSLAFAGGRFAGNPSLFPVDNALDLILSIIPSYLGLQMLSLVAVLLLLLVYIRLQRRAAQTGAAVNWGQRHRELVLTLSVAVTTLVLTPLSNVLQGEFEALFRLVPVLSYGLGIGCVLWLIVRARRVS
jgi:hypothetical protein